MRSELLDVVELGVHNGGDPIERADWEISGYLSLQRSIISPLHPT